MKRVAVTPTRGKGEVRSGTIPRKRLVFDLRGHFLECGAMAWDVCDRLTQYADPKTLAIATLS